MELDLSLSLTRKIVLQCFPLTHSPLIHIQNETFDDLCISHIYCIFSYKRMLYGRNEGRNNIHGPCSIILIWHYVSNISVPLPRVKILVCSKGPRNLHHIKCILEFNVIQRFRFIRLHAWETAKTSSSTRWDSRNGVMWGAGGGFLLSWVFWTVGSSILNSS